MPQLSNQRHERFARALADGAGPDAAALIAGYGQGSGIAKRLGARADVLARVRELGGDGPVPVEAPSLHGPPPPAEPPPPQPSPASGRGGRALALPAVIPGLVPGISIPESASAAEIPGTSPGMTAFCAEAAASDADPPPTPTRQWVLARLVDNVERALQLGEAAGAEASARGKYDGSVANRALELLGKELGMFTDRGDGQATPHDISDQPLTPEEWARRHVR